jgi:hypothetical protein
MEIRTDFEDADFWLVRKGSESSVGKPTKEFHYNHIGLRLNELGRQIADPNYLFYLFTFFHGNGLWARLSKGSLSLKHISVSDVKNFLLPVEMSDNI